MKYTLSTFRKGVQATPQRFVQPTTSPLVKVWFPGPCLCIHRLDSCEQQTRDQLQLAQPPPFAFQRTNPSNEIHLLHPYCNGLTGKTLVQPNENPVKRLYHQERG